MSKALCFPQKPVREVSEKREGETERERLHFTLHCAMLLSHIRSLSPTLFQVSFSHEHTHPDALAHTLGSESERWIAL